MRLVDGRKYPKDPTKLTVGKKSHITKLMESAPIRHVQGRDDNKFKWHIAAIKTVTDVKAFRALLNAFSMADKWLIADKLIVLTSIDDSVSYYRQGHEVHINVPSAGVKYRICFGLDWITATFDIRAHAREYKGIDIRGNEYTAIEDVAYCNPNTWKPMEQSSIKAFEKSLNSYRQAGFSGGLSNAPLMFVSTLDQRAPRRYRLSQEQNPKRNQAIREYYMRTDTVRTS